MRHETAKTLRKYFPCLFSNPAGMVSEPSSSRQSNLDPNDV